MVDPEDEFSIGTLDIGDLAIRVRYRRRCYDDASFRIANEGHQPRSQRQQQRQASEPFSCMTMKTPCLPNQDTPEACKESRRRGAHRPSMSPTESGSSPSADMLPTGQATRHDDNDEKCFDGTGLLVWPGSRLLASFLVDPLGARRLFPQAVGSRSSCCCERRCSCVRGVTSLAVGWQNEKVPSSTTPGHCQRHDELTPSVYDGDVTCGIVCREKKLLPAIRHTTPPAAEVLNGGGCCTATRTKVTHAASQKGGRCGMVALKRAMRRPASPAILELGAGTGICGMAASLSLGSSVIVTDRRDDVLANLRENIKLNGLGQRAQVVRLAWGGAARETREFPAEIREQSPFKVRAAVECHWVGLCIFNAQWSGCMGLLDPATIQTSMPKIQDYLCAWGCDLLMFANFCLR